MESKKGSRSKVTSLEPLKNLENIGQRIDEHSQIAEPTCQDSRADLLQATGGDNVQFGTKCKDRPGNERRFMSSRKEPVLVNVKRSGLSLDFAIRNHSMTGLSIDYQESSKSRQVAEVVDMIDRVVSTETDSRAGLIAPILEGIAALGSDGRSRPGETTLVNVRSAAMKVDMVLRANRVTGLTVDYQQASGPSEIKTLMGVLNRICSGAVRGVPAVHTFEPVVADRTPVAELEVAKEKEPAAEGESGSWEIVVNAVSKALEMLGEQGRMAFIGLLENRYGMRLEEVPAHPRGFMNLLRNTLGPTASAIEKEIISEIRRCAPVRGTTLQEVVASLEDIGTQGTLEGALGHESPVAVETEDEPNDAGLSALEGIPTIALNFKFGKAEPKEPANAQNSAN